jgi:hypothetical protein
MFWSWMCAATARMRLANGRGVGWTASLKEVAGMPGPGGDNALGHGPWSAMCGVALAVCSRRPRAHKHTVVVQTATRRPACHAQQLSDLCAGRNDDIAIRQQDRGRRTTMGCRSGDQGLNRARPCQDRRHPFFTHAVERTVTRAGVDHDLAAFTHTLHTLE